MVVCALLCCVPLLRILHKESWQGDVWCVRLIFFTLVTHCSGKPTPNSGVREGMGGGDLQEHYWLTELLGVPTEPNLQACLSPIAWGQHKLLLSPALSSAAKPPGSAV